MSPVEITPDQKETLRAMIHEKVDAMLDDKIVFPSLSIERKLDIIPGVKGWVSHGWILRMESFYPVPVPVEEEP